VDPVKAKGTPVEPEVMVPSMPSSVTGKQSYGTGRT
jgi:hypothetical protein